MEHSPPPFFKRGPAPLVRLFFFASLSLALLVLDARFQYGRGPARDARAGGLSAAGDRHRADRPVRRAIGGYFSNQSQLIEDNAELRAKALSYARDAQRYQAAEAEAAQLRRLIGATERLRGARDARRGALHRARPVLAEGVHRPRRDARRASGQPGDRRGGRRRPGHARASAALGSDADHRPRPGDPGAGSEERPARGRLRRRRLRHARAALHGGDRRNPGRRPPGHFGHRRHLSGRICRSPPWCASSATPSRASPTSCAGRRPASTAAATCWCSSDDAARPPRPEEAQPGKERRADKRARAQQGASRWAPIARGTS